MQLQKHVAALGAMSITAVAGSFAVAQSAHAYPGCNSAPNQYADQTTDGGYKGQAGWFYTAAPGVHKYTQDFSLTHLYTFVNGGNSEVEVGHYKGYGPEQNAYPYPHFYSSKQDSVTPYTEHDYEEVPHNSWVFYETNYLGYDQTHQWYNWAAYTNSTSPRITWHNKDMAGAGQATAGGEIASTTKGDTMNVSAEPHDQLKTNNSTFSDWTPQLMSSRGDTTRTCNDPGYAFSYQSQFQRFTASGSKP